MALSWFGPDLANNLDFEPVIHDMRSVCKEPSLEGAFFIVQSSEHASYFLLGVIIGLETIHNNSSFLYETNFAKKVSLLIFYFLYLCFRLQLVFEITSHMQCPIQ